MTKHQTPDDALEPGDEIFDPNTQTAHSRGDYATPSAPPTNTSRKKLSPDDPRTDAASDIDQQELYDEGLTSATEADTWEESSGDHEKPVEKY